MNINQIFLLATFSLWAACSGNAKQPQPVDTNSGKEVATNADNKFPKTERIDVVDMLHGVEIRDSYQWLENVEDPKVQSWMTIQDEYTRKNSPNFPNASN